MRRSLTTAVLLCLALSGCGGDDADATPPPAASETSASTGPTDSSSASASATTSASASSSTSASPVAAAAKTQQVTISGKVRGTAALGVSAVQVRGQLAVVDVSFTPQLVDEATDAEVSLYDINSATPVTVFLTDPVGLKRYAVVKDSRGIALEGEYVGVSAVSGQTGSVSFTFAAPPADVTSLDVYVGSFPPFRDVPVQR